METSHCMCCVQASVSISFAFTLFYLSVHVVAVVIIINIEWKRAKNTKKKIEMKMKTEQWIWNIPTPSITFNAHFNIINNELLVAESSNKKTKQKYLMHNSLSRETRQGNKKKNTKQKEWNYINENGTFIFISLSLLLSRCVFTPIFNVWLWIKCDWSEFNGWEYKENKI